MLKTLLKDIICRFDVKSDEAAITSSVIYSSQDLSTKPQTTLLDLEWYLAVSGNFFRLQQYFALRIMGPKSLIPLYHLNSIKLS